MCVQWKLLNVITLGQTGTDNINLNDNNNRLILHLSAILFNKWGL
jgi:hypothetical protein